MKRCDTCEVSLHVHGGRDNIAACIRKDCPHLRREATSASKVGVMPSDAHEGEVQPSKTESL